MDVYWKPWGLLPWILDKLTIDDWAILGAFATEERCYAALEAVNNKGRLSDYKLIFVKDPPSRFLLEIQHELKSRKREMEAIGLFDFDKINEFDLFERYESIVNKVHQYLSSFSSENIIIDITALPKRYFFPIIKLVLEDKTKKNIIATYTRAKSYAKLLAEDPEPWNAIPLFAPTRYPEPDVERIIIAIGFTPLGLPDFFEQGYNEATVKLLLPFPPGPPHFNRNWEFVRRLEKNLPSRVAPDPIRVHPWDLPECYQHIKDISDNGNAYTILAPYGPKTISLAMCLFAGLTKFPVYYTQPKAYNPYYSKGVAQENGIQQIFAYCLRINGVDLYSLD